MVETNKFGPKSRLNPLEISTFNHEAGPKEGPGTDSIFNPMTLWQLEKLTPSNENACWTRSWARKTLGVNDDLSAGQHGSLD